MSSPRTRFKLPEDSGGHKPSCNIESECISTTWEWSTQKLTGNFAFEAAAPWTPILQLSVPSPCSNPNSMASAQSQGQRSKVRRKPSLKTMNDWFLAEYWSLCSDTGQVESRTSARVVFEIIKILAKISQMRWICRLSDGNTGWISPFQDAFKCMDNPPFLLEADKC